MIKGLYVHVPFCNNPCHYCDFAKARFNYGLAVRYLDELERELEGIGQDSFETIYIGGGTPTALPHELLERLLKMISSPPQIRTVTAALKYGLSLIFLNISLLQGL